MLIDRSCPLCGREVKGGYLVKEDGRIVVCYDEEECENSAYVITRVKCSHRGTTKKIQYVHKHCLYKNKKQGEQNK